MDEILQIRAYWISAIVIITIFVPMIVIAGWLSFRNKQKEIPGHIFLCIIAYFTFMFSYGKDIIIPKKYEVEYKNIYQCGYVDVMVPKYPDGVIK